MDEYSNLMIGGTIMTDLARCDTCANAVESKNSRCQDAPVCLASGTPGRWNSICSAVDGNDEGEDALWYEPIG